MLILDKIKAKHSEEGERSPPPPPSNSPPPLGTDEMDKINENVKANSKLNEHANELQKGKYEVKENMKPVERQIVTSIEKEKSIEKALEKDKDKQADKERVGEKRERVNETSIHPSNEASNKLSFLNNATGFTTPSRSFTNRNESHGSTHSNKLQQFSSIDGNSMTIDREEQTKSNLREKAKIKQTHERNEIVNAGI